MSATRGQDVWASVYSTTTCVSSSLSNEQSLPGANTCVPYSANGMTVSLSFQCSGSTEDSAWTAKVFYSSDCSGSVVSTLAGSDACECQGRSVFGYEVGVSVSCTGAAPATCDTVTSSPTSTPLISVSPTATSAGSGTPVWGSVYSTSTCEKSSYIANGTADLDTGCLGTRVDGTDVSLDFTCTSLTEDSSWTAGVYLTTDCSGFRVLTMSATDACTCGGLSLMGVSVGAYVNCGGVAPTTCDDDGSGGDSGDSKSNGSGSDEVLGDNGILLLVVVGFGMVLAVILMRAVYKWKCQDKEGHTSLVASEINKESNDKEPLYRL